MINVRRSRKSAQFLTLHRLIRVVKSRGNHLQDSRSGCLVSGSAFFLACTTHIMYHSFYDLKHLMRFSGFRLSFSLKLQLRSEWIQLNSALKERSAFNTACREKQAARFFLLCATRSNSRKSLLRERGCGSLSYYATNTKVNNKMTIKQF